ncbi:MAG: leucine-rich repeat protein [Bacteroidales bacterium]|nr:leucine-rich repeat protein [Bacteroidales bacterium]
MKRLLLALALAAVTAATASAWTLTLTSSPAPAATLSGAGEYDEGDEVTVTATRASAYSNFTFMGWIDADDPSATVLSSSTSFAYEMPGRDVTLVATYKFNPTIPGDPDTPIIPEPTYTVTISANPAGSTSSITSSFTAEAGTTKAVSVTPTSGLFTFVEWRDGEGQVVSTEKSFTYTVPTEDSQLIACLQFSPTPPADYNINYWDPTTGELLISSISSTLATACDNAIGGSSYRSLVKKLTITCPLTVSQLSYVRSYLKSTLTTLDLRLTQVSEFGSSAFSGLSALTTLILPAETTSFGASSFYGCTSLETITIYATEPPTFTSSSSYFATSVPSTCIVYVPNESVATYESASSWCDKDIRPMYDESTAVGPDDEGWNDLSLLHKLPVAYTHTGEDGATLQYCVEGDDEWHTLVSSLTTGQQVDTWVVTNLSKSVKHHTIEYRLLSADGSTVVPLDDLKEELVDMSHAAVTMQGTWYYDFGNEICPEPSVNGLSTDQFTRIYANNTAAGYATVKVAGVYPYSIGTHNVTFKITALPLPGELALAHPDTEIQYQAASIKPEWVFTDERCAQFVSGTDYKESWSNNYYPGTGKLTVTAVNKNFSGTLTLTFTIVKGTPLERAYTYGLTLPDEETIYDGAAHYATIKTSRTLSGEAILLHKYSDTQEVVDGNPIDADTYDVYLGFEEGDYTLAAEPRLIYTYTIFDLADQEWEALQSLSDELALLGYTTGWNLSGTKIAAMKFKEIKLKGGHVVSLDLAGKNLAGRFPSSIFQLQSLQSVDMSDNYLSGEITSSATLPELTALDLHSNSFIGDLYELSQLFPSLASLDVDDNSFSAVSSPLDPALDLSYVGQNTGVTVALDLLSARENHAALRAMLPTIATYRHAEQDYAEAEPLELWLTTSAYNRVSLLPEATSWAMSLYCDIDDFIATAVSANTLYNESNGASIRCLADNSAAMTAIFTFPTGDTNFDASIDVMDVQNTINQVFDERDVTVPFNLTAADSRADGVVNVLDVSATVDLVLQSSSTTPSSVSRLRSVDDMVLAYVDQAGWLVISSDEPVAAFDITILTPHEALTSTITELGALGFNYKVNQADGLIRIVAWSLNGSKIDEGVTQLFYAGDHATISSVMLANSAARRITTAATGSSGVSLLRGHNTSIELLRDAIVVNASKALCDASVTVTTPEGRIAASSRMATLPTGETRIKLATELTPGMYIVVLKSATRETVAMKTILK